MGAIATSGLTAPSRAERLQRLLTPTEAERRERAQVPAARSRRDWIVDTACFLIAVGGGIYGPGALLENGADPLAGRRRPDRRRRRRSPAWRSGCGAAGRSASRC